MRSKLFKLPFVLIHFLDSLIFPKGSATWREAVVMPWASRWGNSFTVLFELKNIKATTPDPS